MEEPRGNEASSKDKKRQSLRDAIHVVGKVSDIVDFITIVPVIVIGAPIVVVLSIVEGAWFYAGLVLVLVAMLVAPFLLRGQDSREVPMWLAVPLGAGLVGGLVYLLFAFSPTPH